MKAFDDCPCATYNKLGVFIILKTNLLIQVLLGILISQNALARYYDLYRADYVKGPFCSVIGGACAADIDFDNSFFQNPASLTAGGSNWDYDYDLIQNNNLEPGSKPGNDVNASTFMGALAFSGQKYGLGLAFLKQSTKVSALGTFSDDAAGGIALFQTTTTASIYQFNIPFSYRVSSDFNIGISLNAIFLTDDTSVTGGGGSASNSADQIGPSLGLSIGGIYRLSPKFITGGWLRNPMTFYSKQTIATNSPFTKFSYSEDVALHYPWLWAIGIGWTPWQDKNGIYFDLNYVGTTTDGYLLTYDNFAAAEATSRLTRKGKYAVFDPRLGIRLPWYKGSNATISLGSYYEHSRWEGIDGFMHYTAGFAYRFPNFKFLMFDGAEIMLGGDFAKDYTTVFLTYR